MNNINKNFESIYSKKFSDMGTIDKHNGTVKTKFGNQEEYNQVNYNSGKNSNTNIGTTNRKNQEVSKNNNNKTNRTENFKNTTSNMTSYGRSNSLENNSIIFFNYFS